MNCPMSDGDESYDNVDPYNHQDRYDEGDDLMSEPENEITEEVIDEPTNEASTRRGFLQKWGPKVGLGAAALIALKSSGASAVTCRYVRQTQIISPCQSRYRDNRVCDGVIVVYGTWHIYNTNNCAYYGYPTSCC